MTSLLLLPEVQLTLWAIFLLVVECCRREITLDEVALMALLGIGLVLAGTWLQPLLLPGVEAVPGAISPFYTVDALAIFFKRFFLVSTFLVVWMAREHAAQLPIARHEFLILPLFTTVGMLLLASARDFMTLFVALELITVSFYVLVAYQRDRAASLEAGTKYLVVGALSTGFLVYGIAFIFGTVGGTSFKALEVYLVTQPLTPALMLGMLLVLSALGFKVAAVPFHAWAPDVYQGAPAPVSAFLSVASKAAGVVAFLRLFAFGGFMNNKMYPYIAGTLAVLGALTVLLGNLAAMPQRNLKRMLGYSSIGNAGFILMGLSCLSAPGVQAVLVYLGVYLIATLLAFFILVLLARDGASEDIPQLAGLYRRSPLLATGLTVALVSLAGIPPLAGFLGKLGIFAAIWLPGSATVPGNNWLLIPAIIGAVAGLYFYLGPVRSMFWNEPMRDAAPVPVRPSSRLLVVVLAALLVILGFWQQPLADLVAPVLGPVPGSPVSSAR
ncbi:MAG: NADH-quinone oxidoreductase subunit N [Candidatus Methylacidiphilales bacterium]|nr:NADH-quinone oxidoreductase subunit N [Candidatus Methylacidiphilales bacterium]